MRAVLFLCLIGCSSDPAPAGDGGTGGCNAEVKMWPTEGMIQVPTGQPVTYLSNPPSSGQHYAAWATWSKAFTTPVPRPNYVTNELHGGVVLLYHCPEGCPEVVQDLLDFGNALPKDSRCGTGINARWLVTPDNLLNPGVQVAAAAWQWTYTAECFDELTLYPFLNDHYAMSPDPDNCMQGIETNP